MEARDSFCFPKNTKNPNPSPIGKKFGFCCCGAPPGTRTLGPLIKSQLLYQVGHRGNTQDSKQRLFLEFKPLLRHGFLLEYFSAGLRERTDPETADSSFSSESLPGILCPLQPFPAAR